MPEILLIRHSKTAGNRMGRYIGRTDESLCGEGIRQLAGITCKGAEQVYVSPMKRCLETAGLLFPGVKQIELPELRECDFGEFENRNYQELSGHPHYQQWVDSGGTLPFPGGEDPLKFQDRCCLGFEKAAAHLSENSFQRVGMVAHGGTVMSILAEFAVPEKTFYDWQIGNAQGYLLWLEPKEWRLDRKIRVVRRLEVNQAGILE